MVINTMPQHSRSLKVVVLCVLWYALSSTNNIIGKTLLRKYSYPLTLSLFHMAANALFIYPVLMIAGLQTSFHFSKHFLWKFILPLGCGKLLGSVAAQISVWRVSVSYAHTVKASLPIFTVIVGSLFFKTKESYLVYVALLPIVLGVAIATVTEVSFEIYGLLSALLATCTFAVQNLYSKQALREVPLNHFQFLMKISQVSFAIAIPLWIFVDTPVMTNDANLATSVAQMDLILRLSISGFINFMQNIVAFSVLHLLSPLSYSVGNATKRILVITVSLLTLKNPVTTVNFFGMMLAVVGVFCYNRNKIEFMMFFNKLATVSSVARKLCVRSRRRVSYVPIVIEQSGRSERAYDIYSRLLRERIICLFGAIDDTLSSVIVAQLLFLQSESSTKPIHIYINSPGGSVTSGLAIYDTMQYIQPPIATWCVGQACSMGSLLLASGAPGLRHALPHSRIMLHQPHGGVQGQATDIAIQAKEILKLKSMLNGIYSRHTGKDMKDIEDALERDNFMAPEDAKVFGVIDHVLSTHLPMNLKPDT